MCIEGAIAPVRNMKTFDCSAYLELGSSSGKNTGHFCLLAKEPDILVFPLETSDRRYGYVQIIPQTREEFEILKPLLVNYLNSIALNLENRWQKRHLEKTRDALQEHAENLERLVKERTRELEIKNNMLEVEIAHHEMMEKELALHRAHLEDLVKERTAQLEKIHSDLLHTEKLAALGKLTSSIAHEFNNPLYGVRNILEQALDECDLDQEFKVLLGLAVKECNRMADMIRRLREFYKPSSADTEVQLNIHQVIDNMELLVKKQLKTRNITVEKQYAPDLPRVNAVENQMNQVILNLLHNANEALDHHGKIIVRTEALGPKISISIQDTGEGIPEENLSQIFEPFFTTKAVKGTGLGLSVCHGIIKSHGGDIEVKSRIGEGSTFIITLPIVGSF